MRILVAVAAVTIALTACPPSGEPPASPTPAAEPTVPALHPSVDGYPEAILALGPGNDDVREVIAVKVADTPQRRAHGLMEVATLPAATGMLFEYTEDVDGAFWMKDTLVPLDIAFIAADGEVLAVLAMTPCSADPCDLYDPGVTHRSALEVARGWFDDVGLTEGWRISRR